MFNISKKPVLEGTFVEGSPGYHLQEKYLVLVTIGIGGTLYYVNESIKDPIISMVKNQNPHTSIFLELFLLIQHNIVRSIGTVAVSTSRIDFVGTQSKKMGYATYDDLSI